MNYSHACITHKLRQIVKLSLGLAMLISCGKQDDIKPYLKNYGRFTVSVYVENANALPGAEISVYQLTKPDVPNILLANGLTDKSGNFEVKALNPANYVIHVDSVFLGYAMFAPREGFQLIAGQDVHIDIHVDDHRGELDVLAQTHLPEFGYYFEPISGMDVLMTTHQQATELSRLTDQHIAEAAFIGKTGENGIVTFGLPSSVTYYAIFFDQNTKEVIAYDEAKVERGKKGIASYTRYNEY